MVVQFRPFLWYCLFYPLLLSRVAGGASRVLVVVAFCVSYSCTVIVVCIFNTLVIVAFCCVFYSCAIAVVRIFNILVIVAFYGVFSARR